MKKRKILILLMTFLLLVAPLTACDDPSSGNSAEFFKYLGVEEVVYHTSVSQLDGEVVSYNEDRNLVALKTSECSVGGQVTDTYKVYNLETLEVVHTSSCSYSFGDNRADKITSIDLEIYPLIEVNKVSYRSEYDSDLNDYVYYPEYEYLYYLPGEGNPLAQEDSGFATVNKKINLYECKIGDFVYWISSDYEVLRKYPSFVTSTYASPSFDAEYNDYLYSFEFSELVRKIQVYNKEGVCQVEYDYSPKAGLANQFVLNDGNIFVQEFLYVEDGEEYDLEYPNGLSTFKCNVINKIVNYQTGEVTEIEFDYLVEDLATYYSQENGGNFFPFILAQGKHNQAILIKIINKAPTTATTYAVLDNSMKVEYTIKNDTLSTSYYGYEPVGALKDVYFGTVVSGQNYTTYTFDYNGNVKCVLPENAVGYTNKYIVTNYGIFDFDMKKVFDFETCDLVKGTNNSFNVEIHGNEIIATVINAYTGSTKETYRFDGSKLVPIADGIDTNATYMDRCYAVIDLKNATNYVYSYSGETLLIFQSEANTTNILGSYQLKNADIISAEIGGNKLCYVIK